MKKLILIISIFNSALFVSIAQTTPVAADKVPADSSVKQLIALTHAEKITGRMFDNLSNMLSRQVSTKVTDTTKSRKLIAEIMDEIKSLSKQIMDEDMVAAYKKYYTADDVKELIKFYQSPVGEKVIATAASIQQDIFIALNSKYFPAIQEKFKKRIDEMNGVKEPEKK